jgi:hypothetical protein
VATRLYLRATAGPGGYAAGPAGVWASGAPTVDLSAAAPTGPLTLSVTAGSAQTSKAGSTLASLDFQDVYFFRLISDPFSVPVDAHTWTFAFAGSQSNIASNMSCGGCLYVLKDDDTPRGVILDTFTGDPLATSEEGRVDTFLGDAVADVAPTDRLCLEYWHVGGQTMSSSYTQTVYFDGTVDPENLTAASDAASYIQTPQTLWHDPAGDGIEGSVRTPRMRSARY